MLHIEYIASHYRVQLARERRALRDAMLATIIAASIAFICGMVAGMALMAFGP